MSRAPGIFDRLGYRFRDSSLFRQSVTHRSYVNEHPGQAAAHNERMEFLGDAVLDFVISDLLVERFTELAEGELSKIRAGLVSEQSLAELARELELGTHLRMGKGEEQSGGRNKPSILSDAMEALIAAVYLDSRKSGGTEAVYAMVRRLFGTRIEAVEAAPRRFDFKTELQETVQKHWKERVTYKVLSEEGPDHDKIYEVAVVIRDREYGRGRGRSKKESEQAAAESALNEHFAESGA